MAGLNALTRLAITSVLFCTGHLSATEWHYDTERHSFSIEANVSEEQLILNYCFIYNQGQKINCDDSLYNVLKFNESENRYNSAKVINSWNGQLFELNVCLEGDNIHWVTKEEEIYIPKAITLYRD
ncbi:hypothetical protein [Vibrio sp. WXL210]|uniref:hypothetical protein n=1 Tax=Vibrio sp. WXL210 TaxID=3450709 RepID=UPI003EC7859F